MASHMSTIAAETSGANATADNYAIEQWNQQFVKELLDGKWKNEDLLKLLDYYFDDTQKTINFYAAAVQEYLQSANNYQSLIHEGSFESLNISHNHFFHDLVGVYRQQLRMHDSLQSFQNDLAQKLHRAKAWTKASAVAFTAVVLITSAAGAATARAPATMAAVAAAPVLLGAIGTWTHSLLTKYKDGVRKQVEIAGVMAVCHKSTMNNLRSLHSSASRTFQFLTMSASEMAESADVDEVVKKKLTESIHELRGKAASFCRDILLARQLTLHHVITG